MRTIPILFSTPMVKALLDGRKTQTRRIVKPQPENILHDVNMGYWSELPDVLSHPYIKCPYGQPGDVLWVRETWFSTRFDCMELLDRKDTTHIRYKADGNYNPKKDCVGRPWKPNIHMPKKACRLFLKVKSVRVERLQDISEDDAKAEGVDNWTWANMAAPQNWMDYNDPESPPLLSAYDSFMSLWDSINGPESWDANPWVWVVEFERTEKPANWPN